MRKHEFVGGQAPASVLEREARQSEALRVVNNIARATGDALPVITNKDGSFGEKPGVYILDRDASKHGGIKEASFKFDQRMLSGAADSAHAVIAGDLMVRHESGLVVPDRVAAKCYQKRSFEERFARAQREVEVMRDMNERGELALEPIAVAVAPDHAHNDTAVVLFTRFNDNLYTLDSNPWGRGPTAFNTANAAAAAGALGRFNEMGYVHRDAKIKNVAAVAGLGVGMIDFETTDPIDPRDPIQARDAAYTDFDYMMSSLGDKGFFTRRQNKDYSDNSGEILGAVQEVCDSYLLAWGESSADVQAQVLDVTMQVADNITTRALGAPANV
jgi:hypothetical protein